MDAMIFQVPFTFDILGLWVKERLSAVWGRGEELPRELMVTSQLRLPSLSARPHPQ